MKKISIVIFLFLICGVITTLIENNYYHQEIIKDTKINQVNTNVITMMYEIESGSGEYQVSSNNAWPQKGYEFNDELSKCENGSILIWDDENKKILMQANTSDKCYIYFDRYNTAATTITNLFYSGSLELGNLDSDKNIRYAGTDPSNYIIFNNELWRIVGVFNNKLKIIRNDSLPVVLLDKGITVGDTSTYIVGNITANVVDFFYWNYNGTNNWETATLNMYLNGTYYNSIQEESKKMIDKETWYLGGYDNVPSKATDLYKLERGLNVYSRNPVSTKAYIGLSYLSDIF